MASGDGVEVIHEMPQPAGDGGWPTIRYFNKGTGYGGAGYAQKTPLKVCEELGDLDRLRSYIADKSHESFSMSFMASIVVLASLCLCGVYFLYRPQKGIIDKGKKKAKEAKKRK